MAETGDDPSIWRLLAAEHAFITGLVENSEKLADELVQSFLEEGEIDRDGRVRYRIWQVRALSGGGGAPSPYDGAFWQSDPEHGVRCEIDHRNSSARWTGPASAEWQASGRKTAERQLMLIRLNHLVVLDFLRGVGLPLAEQPASELAMELVPATEPKAGNPSAPEPVPLKVWLRKARREHPQLLDKNETHKDWAERMIGVMKTDKAAGLIDHVWPQGTMERRLRDKDRDDDGSYQVGN